MIRVNFSPALSLRQLTQPPAEPFYKKIIFLLAKILPEAEQT
jgi:hypothetical protein